MQHELILRFKNICHYTKPRQLKMGDEAIDIENVSLRSAVVEALERLLKDRGAAADDCNYEIKRATEKGENYIGVVYRVTANITDVEGKRNKFNCFLKVPPANPARRKQFFARPCFLRESLAYESFLPMIESFQNSKNLECIEQRFHEYANCFCSLTEELNEAIIMEDLSVKGFKLFDRFKEMDVQHVSAVMCAYAKLHAISFAIKDQSIENLSEFQSIVDIFEQRKDDEQLAAYFEYLKVNALKSLDDEKDKQYLNILKRYFEENKFFDLFLGFINAEDCEAYAVVCHGDCWSNNILFKYEHENVIDLCLIDWQIMRYASPVTDLMYFLFACTTRDFRRKNYAKMLDVYYNELSAHVQRLGSNPAKNFPREALDNQLKNKGAIGLLFAMLVLPIITLKSEETPDLEELSQRIESGETTDLDASGFLGTGSNAYEERMRDVIIDIIDYGYIADASVANK